MGYYTGVGHDYPEPQEIETTVACIDLDYGAYPTDAVEFVQWLQGLIAEAPEGQSVQIGFRAWGGGDWGDATPEVTLKTIRHETADEVADRLSKCAQAKVAAAQQREFEERRALAALKAKYEA